MVGHKVLKSAVYPRDNLPIVWCTLLFFQICKNCTGCFDRHIPCVSLNCPVLYKLSRVNRELSKAPYLRQLLDQFKLSISQNSRCYFSVFTTKLLCMVLFQLSSSQLCSLSVLLSEDYEDFYDNWIKNVICWSLNSSLLTMYKFLILSPF